MSMLLKIYPTFGSRMNNEWEDLTAVVYNKSDLGKSPQHLIAKADRFCGLNSYYAYELYVDSYLIASKANV